MSNLPIAASEVAIGALYQESMPNASQFMHESYTKSKNIAGLPMASCESVAGVPSVQQLMRHFGQTVKAKRMQLHLTQDAVAKAAGFKIGTLQRQEALAKPSLQPGNFVALAKALGMTPDELEAEWKSGTVKHCFSISATDSERLLDAATRRKLSAEDLLVLIVSDWLAQRQNPPPGEVSGELSASGCASPLPSHPSRKPRQRG